MQVAINQTSNSGEEFDLPTYVGQQINQPNTLQSVSVNNCYLKRKKCTHQVSKNYFNMFSFVLHKIFLFLQDTIIFRLVVPFGNEYTVPESGLWTVGRFQPCSCPGLCHAPLPTTAPHNTVWSFVFKDTGRAVARETYTTTFRPAQD